MKTLLRTRYLLPAIGFLLLALPVAAGFEDGGTLEADHVSVRNLIGEIEVQGHDKPYFELQVRIQGADAESDLIRLETVEGRKAEWNIVFPLDESRRYVYPRMGRGNTHIEMNEDRGWLSRLFGGNRLEVSGRGNGLEIWADATLLVPYGKSFEVDLGVGEVKARGLEGKVAISTRSGRISIAEAGGRISADTGSGSITLESLRGEVTADTGSGSVTLDRFEGKSVSIDTGSGSVELQNVVTEQLDVDTGSGSVKARAVETAEASIDTGSGSVYLQLDRMGTGRFDIDTGSGGIDLVLPPGASADVQADTGSGGVTIELAGDYNVQQKDRDQAKLRVGGGEARVDLATGSGGIRISQK